MEEKEIKDFIEEYREEQHISPFRTEKEFEQYVLDGVYDINKYCGKKIDYRKDLKARRLLKNYVLYADYKRLAEFKRIYIGEYDELQREYYTNTNVQ